MFSFARSHVRLFFFALLCLSAASAQTSSSDATGAGAVSGQVVDSVSGQGIPRALIELRVVSISQTAVARNPSRTYEVRHLLTDSQGQFHVEGLPLGQGSVGVRKPGYMPLLTMPREGGESVGLVTVSADDSAPLTLHMVPQGTIAGAVVGSTGEPLEDVRVSVYYWQVQSGHGAWRRQQVAATDEDGRFRIAGLSPGRYYLVSTPTAVP